MKTYSDILATINQKPVMPTYIPSLESIKNAIQDFFMDIENYSQQMLLVAGTNGKGSTAKALETFFLASGKEVALYTSPHLVKINERFRLNGNDITDSDFVDHYLKVEPFIKKYSLSHFEVLTLIALSYFRAAITSGTYCIWEVGMGGRWDATNAIPHAFNIITTIGNDHQKYLGSTMVEIAKNKFDIIQPNSKTITGFLPSPCFQILEEVVHKQKSEWLDLAKDTDFQAMYQYQRKDSMNDAILYKGKDYRLGLCGERGYQNTLLALYAFKAMGFVIDDNTLKAIPSISWKHRFSLLQTKFTKAAVYLSGDHNPEGIESLCKIIERLHYNKLWILCGITEGREPDSIFNPLLNFKNAELVLTESPFKGLPISDYEKSWSRWQEYRPKMFKDPAEGFQYICNKADTEDVVIVTGSLYLTGKIDEIFATRDQT